MRFFAATLCFLFVSQVSALSFSQANLRYRDIVSTFRPGERVAIAVVTNEGIMEGDPGGTFRPNDPLNRAEFATIAERLLSESDRQEYESMPCFDDVPADSWYAYPVCKVKALGIVRGNERPGVDPDRWLYEPTRSINVAEATKMLVELFRLPLDHSVGGPWYDVFMDAATPVLIGTWMNTDPGHIVTRGEVAELIASFLAYENAELAEYRFAQGIIIEEADDLLPPVSSSISSSSASSVSSPSMPDPDPDPDPDPVPVPVPSSQSSSVSSSVTYDPIQNTSQSDTFLLLGSVSPVLAGVNVFSDSEPVVIETIHVNLATAASSIDHFLVYDHDRVLLGRASQEDTLSFALRLRNQDITIPHRDNFSFYVRAVLKPYDAGGSSGQDVQISSAGISGYGEWSNNGYTKSSTDTFSQFETARARFTSIANAGPSSDVLLTGERQLIGSYRFEGETGDGAADLRVTDITFSLSVTGGASISNVLVGADSTSDTQPCTLGSSTITCSSITAQFGDAEDGPRILKLFADVSIDPTAQKSSVTASISSPGSVSSAGSVTWTDGDQSFSWVPFGAPVAGGTNYSQ